MTNKRILVISPHSDDAELGCGGYVAKQVAQGHPVHVICIVIKDEEQLHHKGIVSSTTRKYEFIKAMKSLDVYCYSIMLQKEKGFDLCCYPKSRTIAYLDDYIKENRIDTVFLPVPSFHQDHQYVYECGIAATRLTKYESTVRNVFAYEYPAANWGESASLDSSKGGYYVDITDNINNKIEALKCHKSQLSNRENSLISLEGVKILARMRGLEISKEYAEMFYVLRMVEL